MLQQKTKTMNYIFIMGALLFLFSCNICEKKVGRVLVEIRKEDLVCSCKDLKRDSLIGKKLFFIHKDSSRYLLGAILTDKNNRGLYQYVKVSPSITVHNYMYYDGFKIHTLNDNNLLEYGDSLMDIGLDRKKIDKIMSLIQGNLSKPLLNDTDNF